MSSAGTVPVIKPPMMWPKLISRYSDTEGLVLTIGERPAVKGHSVSKPAIRPMELKTILSKQQVDDYRNACGPGLGAVPDKLLALLEGEGIERTMGYIWMKGNVLYKYYNFDAAQMEEWLARRINPTVSMSRYAGFEEELQYEVFLDRYTEFAAPTGYTRIWIVRCVEKTDRRRGLAKDRVYLKCPMPATDERLIQLVNFCYQHTTSPSLQRASSMQRVQSHIIQEDQNTEEPFGLTVSEAGDPLFVDLIKKPWKNEYKKLLAARFKKFATVEASNHHAKPKDPVELEPGEGENTAVAGPSCGSGTKTGATILVGFGSRLDQDEDESDDEHNDE